MAKNLSGVFLIRPNGPKVITKDIEEMFRLRHLVFNERLGWKVQSVDGMEIDAFDLQNPVYALSRGQQGIDACWRLLPTTSSYMLKDVFPELLGGEPAPQGSTIWELSRFAVHGGSRGDLAQGTVNPVVFRMMQKIFEFAQETGIKQFVTVTSVAIERLFRHAGIPLRRFGDGKARKMGKVLSVACWIDLNEETRNAVYRLSMGKKREAA